MGVVFQEKMWCRKLFYVGHQLFVEYREQYGEHGHGQFIVQYSVHCSGQYSKVNEMSRQSFSFHCHYLYLAL